MFIYLYIDTILYCTIPYYTILYCTILYYAILYYTILLIYILSVLKFFIQTHPSNNLPQLH